MAFCICAISLSVLIAFKWVLGLISSKISTLLSKISMSKVVVFEGSMSKFVFWSFLSSS